MRWGAIAVGLLLTPISAWAEEPGDPPAALPPVTNPAPVAPPTAEPSPPPAGLPIESPAGPSRWVDDHHGPDNATWLKLDYGLWQIKNSPLPIPLAVNATGGTLVGGSSFDYGTFALGRIEAGWWFNQCHTHGLYIGGFLTEQRAIVESARSDGGGSPMIIRPFVDALTGAPSALIVSSPLVLSGSMVAEADARLGGGKSGLIWNLFECESYSVNALAGFRYLNLDEDLAIAQQSQQITIAPAPPLRIEDRFHTRNQFWGGQIGSQAEYRIGPISAAVTYTVSLGTNHEVVEVAGQTTGLSGAMGAVPGGLLALSGANAGRETQNRFVVIPEVGGVVGWQVAPWLRLTVGYDFLYVNDVVRPGAQIDPFINQKFVPVSPAFGSTSGPNYPTRAPNSDSFYAHGVQFGVELKY